MLKEKTPIWAPRYIDGRKAPLNGHNFDVWSNFEIPAGGDKIIVLKSKIVSKG